MTDPASRHASQADHRNRIFGAKTLGGPVFHDLLASRFGQRLPLRSGMGVVVGTDPEVADQHGAAPRDAAWFGPGLGPRGSSPPWALTSVTIIDVAPLLLHICNSPGHFVGGGIDRSRLSTSQRVNGTAR